MGLVLQFFKCLFSGVRQSSHIFPRVIFLTFLIAASVSAEYRTHILSHPSSNLSSSSPPSNLNSSKGDFARFESEIPFNIPPLVKSIPTGNYRALHGPIHYSPRARTPDVQVTGLGADKNLTQYERRVINNLEFSEKVDKQFSHEPQELLDSSLPTSQRPKHLLTEEHQIKLTDIESDGSSVHPFDSFYDLSPNVDEPPQIDPFSPIWKDDATPMGPLFADQQYTRLERLKFYTGLGTGVGTMGRVI